IMGIDELHADMRDFLLPFLAKTKEDRKRLTLQDGFASLVLRSHRHLSWSATGQKSVYGLIEGVLKAQKYRQLSKGQKSVVKGFLAKVTALSRAQITRLIRRWIQTRRIERQPSRQPSFPRRYTAVDVAVLAEVDAAHEDLSGPAVRYLC